MKKLFYPAIFQIEENGYFVKFPDVEGAVTEGENMENAYEMAVDALGLVLSYLKDNNRPLPLPSAPQNIKTDKDQFVVVIEFDMQDYLRKHNNKSVKKTLSIPQWLNEEALAKNVNFSKVLQDALIAIVQN